MMNQPQDYAFNEKTDEKTDARHLVHWYAAFALLGFVVGVIVGGLF